MELVVDAGGQVERAAGGGWGPLCPAWGGRGAWLAPADGGRCTAESLVLLV